MSKRLLTACIALYAMIMLSLAWADDPTQIHRVVASTAEPVTPVRKTHRHSDDQMLGFTMGVHAVESIQPYLRAIEEVADMGCNTINILTPAYQNHGGSTTLRFEPDRCPSRDQLKWIIRQAKGYGMRVILMPIVLFSHPRGSEWRGKIQPDSWNAWWASYRGLIHHFASIARESDVDVLSVGSELLSSERQRHRWLEVVQVARNVYRGKLTYSTNWDHYHVTSFWDRLDMVGINGYWQVGDDADTPQQEVTSEWKKIRQGVEAFATKTNKPILFTEIGYPSLPWGLKDPWNYVSKGSLPTPQVQVKGYRGFLDAWNPRLGKMARVNRDTPIAGVLFYEWEVLRPNPGGWNDTGYGIKGKPTEPILRKWFADQLH